MHVTQQLVFTVDPYLEPARTKKWELTAQKHSYLQLHNWNKFLEFLSFCNYIQKLLFLLSIEDSSTESSVESLNSLGTPACHTNWGDISFINSTRQFCLTEPGVLLLLLQGKASVTLSFVMYFTIMPIAFVLHLNHNVVGAKL